MKDEKENSMRMKKKKERKNSRYNSKKKEKTKEFKCIRSCDCDWLTKTSPGTDWQKMTGVFPSPAQRIVLLLASYWIYFACYFIK